MLGPAHAACVQSLITARMGYNPDTVLGKRKNVVELLASSNNVRVNQTIDKSQWVGTIMNQGQDGSCGGHGTAKEVKISHGDAGFPITGDVSPKFTYAGARREYSPATYPNPNPLTDSGIDPTSLLDWLMREGWVPIGTDSQCPTPDGRYSDIWGPADTSAVPPNVNDDVQLDAEIAGRMNLDVTPYDIDVSGGTQQVRLAFGVQGTGVGLGIFVDSAFMNWNPANGPLGGTANLNDPNGGGHWVTNAILSYDANGNPLWTIPNSWGIEWGQSGLIVVQDAWLASSLSQSIAMKVNSASKARLVA